MSRSIRWLPAMMLLLLLLLSFDAVAGAGNRTMDYTWLLFLKVNAPPEVNAGADLQITSNRANLNGTVNDAPGDTLTYTWTKVSGPGSVAFSNSSAEDTSVAFSSSGTYVLRLSASDGELASSDQVIITVTNTAPQVNAGADKRITHPINSVSLNATVSDAQNNIQAFAWSKVTGPGSVVFGSPSAEDTTAVFSVTGTYTLRLRANDWELATTDTVTVDYLSQSAPKIDVVVAIGDSITDGFGDSDCVYQQSKTSCTGYESPLKDKLKGTSKYASNLAIFDEGVGGKTSAWGRDNIGRISSNHYPAADQYLVMFGTNDADVDPPLSTTAFKYNMQSIINTIKSKGAKPALAKAPYAKGNQTYRNPWIREYNNAVDQLVSANSISVSPPDFYGYFQSHQDQIHTYFMFNAEAGTPGRLDNIHPTHDGYQGMVNIWYDKLR